MTGLFICHCGETLSKSIDFKELEQWLKNLPSNVIDEVMVEIVPFLCSEKEQKELINKIKNCQLEKVILAGCSQEGLLRKCFNQAGISPLVVVANIKDQCFADKKATQKAKILVAMALKKVQKLKPVLTEKIPVCQDVLILGGGIAGIESALALAHLGYSVTLAEKSSCLGGLVSQLKEFYSSDQNPAAFLSVKIEEITNNKLINLLYNTELTKLEREVGSFTAYLRQGQEEKTITAGAVVLATGVNVVKGKYPLGKGVEVVTHLELDSLLTSEAKLPQRICFMLGLAGSETKIFTASAFKKALRLKNKTKGEVYILYKDLQVNGMRLEDLYKQTRKAGVIFLKYDGKPQVSCENGQYKVYIRNMLKENPEEKLLLPCEMVVVNEKLLASTGLEDILGIDLGPEGFYQEDNVQLAPVNTNKKGIFVAGSCKGLCDISECVTQAKACALGIHQLLADGFMEIQLDKAVIDPDKCVLCLTCLRTCPHKAIEIVPYKGNKHELNSQVAQVSLISCQACGICASVCPNKAIQLTNYTDEQILVQLECLR